MSSAGISGISSSILLSLYQAQQTGSTSAIAAANAANQQQAATTKPSGATANDVLPWNTPTATGPTQNAKVLSTTDYLDTTNVPLTAGATTDSKLEQDNQKLFSVYNAVNTLEQLATMAQSSTATSGQLAGLNDRFQTGLSQITNYLNSTTFNGYDVQLATPASSTTSTAGIGFANYTYNTKQLVTNSNLNNALPGLSSSSNFTIAIKKGGTTTNVPIDLSKVSGTLNLTNIVSYINSQLSAAGFQTRFQKTETGGTATSDANATYGLSITPGGTEQVSLSAASTPALYMAGSTGVATETNTVTNAATGSVSSTPADQRGRLTKLSAADGSSIVSVTQQSSTGTSTAQATAVDSSGNIYVIGTATGNFGNELNQGDQDTYLTKYDSAGNVLWQHLLGSDGTANAYGLALDPATGGVVVSGTSTAALTQTSVADGSNDSFVASYASDGTQSWISQIPTLAANQANAVSVDASGNIYIGGSVTGGVIGSGQASSGGGDAFLAKLSSKGKILAENQFGTSGSDSVAATATGSDGSLYVASTQNGHAIVTKYAGGDITSAPVWSQDMGALQAGGMIGGLAVSNGKVYLSGATSNANLTAGGQATIAAPSSGGTDAFVASITDNGTSATANTITYVGTAGTDTGGDVTVAADGTVYLTGSTTGTFAGATRNVPNVTNAFATAISATGTVNWTRQFGGSDGISTGAGLAIDPNGASVLDALGLPKGTITFNQSVDLTQNTTLRAGDSFQIKIEGAASRTATISIDQGETFDSLATKINAQLGSIGKASVNYTGTSENLKIVVNSGQTIDLLAGPDNFDALSRLGITAGTLSAATTTTATSATNYNKSSTAVTPTYGLGLTATALGPLDISTKTGADLTRSTLLQVLSNIQSVYQKTNAPPPATTVGNTKGTASIATTSQLSSYNAALSLIGNDGSNAYANIQQILAQAQQSGVSTG
jgi:hypothetical protein